MYRQHLPRAWGERLFSRYSSIMYPKPSISSECQRKVLSTYRPIKHLQTSTNLLRRWNSSTGVTWLWEASKAIRGFDDGNQRGTRTGFIEMTLNSVQPLESQLFREALTYLQRKVPNLRTVLRPRGDSLWFCQPHEQELDFEVLADDVNFREEMFHLLDRGFQDADSVHWMARLIERGADVPCLIEGLRERYPYQYDFAVGMHHGLADGIDGVFFFSVLHQILNDLIDGRKMTDDVVGVFEDNRELETLVRQRRERLMKDRKHFETIKTSMPSYGSIPLVLQAFPSPKVSTPTTRHITRIIDSQMIKELLSKCTEVGVTFNSFCTAASNVAIMELMKEAGLKQDSYRIGCLIFVNGRRYMMTSKKHLHGCYMLALSYRSEVESNAKEFFWEYCKKINSELKEYLKDGRPLDQAVVQEEIDAQLPSFNYLDNPKPALHDFSITNLGDISQSLLPGEGKHVQISNLQSFNRIHNFRNSFIQEFSTFRERTLCTFSYATNYFSEETANLIVNKVLSTFATFRK